METLILLARVGLSLAAVLALLWWLGRRMQGSAALKRRRREGLVVLGRQQLGGKSGVALVEVDGRRLVVGYGEQGVSLLLDGGAEASVDAQPGVEEIAQSTAELVPAQEPVVQIAEPAKVREAAPVHVRSTPARMAEVRRPRSPLEGSILAPDTWRKAVVAAQEWTTRRS